MMRKERDRQHQEDMLILGGDDSGRVTRTIVQDQQKPVGDDVQEFTTQIAEETTGNETIQQNDTIASTGSEYDENGHNALRFVCFSFFFFTFPTQSRSVIHIFAPYIPLSITISFYATNLYILIKMTSIYLL